MQFNRPDNVSSGRFLPEQSLSRKQRTLFSSSQTIPSMVSIQLQNHCSAADLRPDKLPFTDILFRRFAFCCISLSSIHYYLGTCRPDSNWHLLSPTKIGELSRTHSRTPRQHLQPTSSFYSYTDFHKGLIYISQQFSRFSNRVKRLFIKAGFLASAIVPQRILAHWHTLLNSGTVIYASRISLKPN